MTIAFSIIPCSRCASLQLGESMLGMRGSLGGMGSARGAGWRRSLSAADPAAAGFPRVEACYSWPIALSAARQFQEGDAIQQPAEMTVVPCMLPNTDSASHRRRVPGAGALGDHKAERQQAAMSDHNVTL